MAGGAVVAMTNPTTLIAAFDDSLAFTDAVGSGTFTGVGPIRYDSGLWLEGAVTNLFPNPRINGASLSPWFNKSQGGETTSFSTPVDAANADQSVSVVGPGSAGFEGLLVYTQDFHFSLTGAADQYVAAFDIEGTGTLDLVLFRAFYSDASFSDSASTSLVLGSATRFISPAVTLNPAKTCDSFQLFLIRSSTPSAFSFKAGGFDFTKAPATSHTDGTLGDAYDWESTAHDSNSTRAAATASVATAGHIDPASGSLALQLTRQIDTGAEERYFECGTIGSGTDALRGGVDSSDHPFVEWNSNNAGWERLTSTATVSADTEFVYLTDWTGTVTRLQIDDASIESGARDTPEGDWGAGNLILEAA